MQQGEQVVFYGIDLGKQDMTGYWLYDPVHDRYFEISEEEYKELVNGQ